MKRLLGIASILFVFTSTTFAIAAEDYMPPRTSFGVPDVQGVWTYETRTSLQTPEIYEGQLEINAIANQ